MIIWKMPHVNALLNTIYVGIRDCVFEMFLHEHDEIEFHSV